jgi:mono/diheme cytochrome c family protein
MSDVVEKSTSHLNDYDLHAIATYLKDLPGHDDGGRNAQRASDDRDVLARGRLVYVDQCEGCHMGSGEGLSHVFPPMKGNTAVHADNVTSLARVVLEGAHSAKTAQRREGFAMPGFGAKLSDAEIADVLTYVRASFGNQAAPVTPSQVADVRKRIASR